MIRNLSALSAGNFNKFFKSFNTIFCDYDGVITDHYTQKPMKNVIETLKILKSNKKEIYFLTNNTTYNTDTLTMNDLTGNDIITPTDVMINYLRTIKFNKEIYVIGSKNMKNRLQNSGFKLTDEDSSIIDEDFNVYVRNLDDNPRVGCVIMDWDFNVTHVKLLRASVYLTRPDVLYLTGSVTQKLRKLDKVAFGVGFFHNAISNFCKRRPLVFGKPSVYLKNYIFHQYKLQNPTEVLMIGDSYAADMHFASICGFQKLLVLCGLSHSHEINTLSTDLLPDYYLDAFGDFRQLLNNY